PILAAAFPDAEAVPRVSLPEALQREVSRSEAWVALVRGRIEHVGPTAAADVGEFLDLEESQVSAALEALEGQGTVLRGSFTQAEKSIETNGHAAPVEWCDR